METQGEEFHSNLISTTHIPPDSNIIPSEIPNRLPDLNIPIEQISSEIESSQISDSENNFKLRRCLTSTQRSIIFESLLLQSVGTIAVKLNMMRLSRGLASQFDISRKTVSRIWKKEKECIENESTVDVSMKPRVRRKRVEITFDQISAIPLRDRTNIRRMSTVLKILKSTTHRRIQEGAIRARSNSLKPFLTEDNKKLRLKFCVFMINQDTVDSQPMFTNMYDYVHIDEKWFYLIKVSQIFYLHPQEIKPLRTCKSKRFITKVMFLGAVARPRITAANEQFSGKIGIFPFVFKEPAKRSSKNRLAGTLETKAIQNINKDVIR
ncbi:uncharacterized protein LOC126668569 [Mercurialis annua]|uniref:uncharacterized protein LOC126668569 n=1 Tax=Mercurialis annua TaxID=3986 RepID=UPI00215F10F5|nr:uncharacterized protein LOC126668569 [Mercurialis annua]